MTGKRQSRLDKSALVAAKAEPDDDSRNLVNSLAKGLRVLEAFTAERAELTLSEVGALAKLDALPQQSPG